jgi:GAF domain-containing protein/ANTAR domain-containing protein
LSVIDEPAVEQSAQIDDPIRGAAPGGALRVVAEPDNMIDAAVEVLMVRHQVSREEAGDLLEQASSERDRTSVEVAEDVVLIGLPDLNPRIELRPVSPPEPVSTASDAAHRAHSGAADRTLQPSVDAVGTRLLDLLVGLTTLPALLAAISELAVEMVAGCESASVTVVAEGAPATVASRDDLTRQIDQIQYRTGEGPYLQAARTSNPVLIDDIGTQPADHAWRQLAQQSGFTAVLSVPIDGSEDIAAGISLYTRRSTGWPPASVQAAQTFAVQAGKAIALANRLASTGKDS